LEENIFEIRDRLAEKAKEIQKSGIETSEGWETLNYLRTIEYTMRLFSIPNYIGVSK